MNDAFTQLTRIESWPNVGLALALVVIVGYCFRFWKSFPNQAIPAIVILTGAVAMMLLAPDRATNIPARVWHARNCIVGLIVGGIGWMGHNLIISRIEDYLASRFDSVAALFGKPLSKAAPQEPKDPPKTTGP